MNEKEHDFLDDSTIQRYLKKLKNGAVLLARDALEDPNFSTAVVLVCACNKENGVYGLVINRPSHMPLSEIFDGFTGYSDPREIYIGGPVRQEELQVLQVTAAPADNSLEVVPRVFLGGRWDNLEKMLDCDPATTRLFLGYSGWAEGQLEAEISSGAWNVYAVDVEKLLLNPAKAIISDSKSIAAYLESLAIQIA